MKTQLVFPHKYLFLIVTIFCEFAFGAGSSVTVNLPPACMNNRNESVTVRSLNISCLAERAKYKCTPIADPIKGIGSYYGKGDKFTGGATLCEKPFYPNTDKVLALQDSLVPRKIFKNGLCGRKAVVIAFEPDTGRCVSTEVEVSDTGNLGAKDTDRNNATRDILKRDVARVGKLKGGADLKATGIRAFDLSYAAAKALQYADDGEKEDDGTAYMEVTICKESAPARVAPRATLEEMKKSMLKEAKRFLPGK